VSDAPAERKPRLLDPLRQALRSRHYSRRSEQTYCHWVRRFIFFRHVRHPAEMAEPEINAFLTHWAVKAAVRQPGLAKRATCHTFRHSFATYLLEGQVALLRLGWGCLARVNE
jgi:integrase